MVHVGVTNQQLIIARLRSVMVRGDQDHSSHHNSVFICRLGEAKVAGQKILEFRNHPFTALKINTTLL